MLKSLLTFSVLSAVFLLGNAFAAAEERPNWVTNWLESPHQSSRDNTEITSVIVHFTAGASLESTVNWFRNAKAQASAHYVVGRDGRVYQMVELDRMAWHAGRSELDGRSGVNKSSIGIEICNWGKLKKEGDEFLTYTGNKYSGPTPFKDANGEYWEPFTDEQYEVVAKICAHSIEKFPINYITGHSHIAVPVGRKNDPGNAFDWDKLRSALPTTYQGQFGPIDRKK